MKINESNKNVYVKSEYLNDSFSDKGIGGWRMLYLKILDILLPESIMEVGAGSPEFLVASPQCRKLAVDVGNRYNNDFARAGVEFAQRDLDSDNLADLGQFECIICSDVFEHLVNPGFALDHIFEVMAPNGFLIAHVPNEYRLDTLKTMLGTSTSIRFHTQSEEWNDPHFRRFTDIGFQKFLSRRFQHLIKITDLRYGKAAKIVKSMGLPVPYCLEGGPTYLCTNDKAVAGRLRDVKKSIKN